MSEELLVNKRNGEKAPMDLEKIRTGDPTALKAWFDDHVDKVYGFVFYRVGNDSQAAAEYAHRRLHRVPARTRQPYRPKTLWVTHNPGF